MNKSIIIGALVITLVAGGVAAYMMTQRDSAEVDNQDLAMRDESRTAQMEQEAMGSDAIDTATDDEDDDMMENEDMMDDDDDMMEESDDEAGQYVEYTPQAYAASADEKRVLFFHAGWCPTCKAADADIAGRLDEIPEDVVIFKTDYDTETDLKDEYGITYQHTFVQVDEDGNEVTKWNGGEMDEILENVM